MLNITDAPLCGAFKRPPRTDKITKTEKPQKHYDNAKSRVQKHGFFLVGTTGLEPVTSRM